jgi:hypothetical protein
MRLVQELKSVKADAEKIEVGGFAAVINSRLAAETRIARAISFAWGAPESRFSPA